MAQSVNDAVELCINIVELCCGILCILNVCTCVRTKLACVLLPLLSSFDPTPAQHLQFANASENKRAQLTLSCSNETSCLRDCLCLRVCVWVRIGIGYCIGALVWLGTQGVGNPAPNPPSPPGTKASARVSASSAIPSGVANILPGRVSGMIGVSK